MRSCCRSVNCCGIRTHIERVQEFLGIDVLRHDFPRLNGHAPRRQHGLAAALLRFSLRHDIRATCELLDWPPQALIEER